MQTGQDDGEAEPQARESDDPEPSVSGKRKIIRDRGKEASKGNDGTTDSAACGTGRADICYCRICKAVETFLEHETDFVFDLAKDGWIRMRR